MAIELPSKPDVLAKNGALDERLISLEAAFYADAALHESPALSAPEPPRTARDVLAWTTRRFGPALIAVTAALSIATGYVVSERTHAPAAAPQPARHAAARAAAVALPHRHAPPAAQHRTAAHQPAHPTHHAALAVPAAPPHHASAPVAHYAAAPVAHHATAPVAHHAAAPAAVVRHEPQSVVPAVAPRRQTVGHVTAAPHRVHAAAPVTAADQLARWEATHPASSGRAHPASAADPGPQAQPRSEPASATATATSAGTRTEPATTPAQGGAPDSTSGGVKTPPTRPSGPVWTDRLPGGTLGGVIGPILGVPRDSCTPRGGRVGIVMQAISVLTSGR